MWIHMVNVTEDQAYFLILDGIPGVQLLLASKGHLYYLDIKICLGRAVLQSLRISMIKKLLSGVEILHGILLQMFQLIFKSLHYKTLRLVLIQ